MSTSALSRAYRYTRVADNTHDNLSPGEFFDTKPGAANTIYVVAAAHHQRDLQPVILVLVCSI